MRLLKLSLLACVLLSFWATSSLLAQTPHKVSGLITDTAGSGLATANITLIAGGDTIKRVSNDQGKFEFRNIKSNQITVLVTMIGFHAHTASFELGDKSTTLPPIVLRTAGSFLKEVVIEGKPNPMRVLKDTLEFDAAAYNIMEEDRLNDLLKQLPGVEVDEDNNVKSMGKEMVKLRVNGKDFFTNNVQEFIAQLPASIVSKIQIIDNYGDQANFTGDRTGISQKMLNIVTKPGMDKGSFGNLGLNGGTNDQIGVSANMNIWKNNQQIGSSANFSRANNGAGKGRTKSAAVNYRDTFEGNVNTGISYQVASSNNDIRNISFIETVNTLGTIYNEAENIGNNENLNNSLNWDVQKTGEKNFLNIGVGVNFQKNETRSVNQSIQSGIIRQDLRNESRSRGHSPNLNVSTSWSKRFKQKHRNLSLNIFLSTTDRTNKQNIKTNTLYYRAETQAVLKDSLLDRRIDSRNKNLATAMSISYNHPLKQPKDSLASRSLGLSYSLSFSNADNKLLTYVNDAQNEETLIDSLSNLYESQSIAQSAIINYSFSNKKLNYNIGMSVRPTLLVGDYRDLQQKIRNTAINYAPSFSLNRTISTSKTLSVRYTGNSVSPNATQLQPVRNTQNLQNVVVGNPGLRPSFNHSLSSGYNYVHLKTGSSFQAGLNLSTTQNQIVRNVILISDTLNSLKQETRFENANGGFDLNGNYNLSLPFSKNRYNIGISGNIAFNNAVTITDNVKYFNKGIQFSQGVSANMTTKKFNASFNASYNFSTNNFTLNNGANRNIETWNLSLASRATIFKTYRISSTVSKRINSGYAIQNNNPTLIGASLSKVFFTNRSLSLNVSAHDLLNEGNNLSRSIVGNSVVDSQNNQITRFFTFGLTYNLQKFAGGK